MAKRILYLDNAATTKTAQEVVKAMSSYWIDYFGNPSSLYIIAGAARRPLVESRETIAQTLGAKPAEIYFTSGGTESDNWAIKGAVEGYSSKGKHIVTSAIEHHAILHTCKYLENNGYEVTYVGVDENGIIKLDELKAAVRPDTVLVSVMFANNEIGTIQPIREIAAIAKEKGALFHTDAIQAYGHIPINVDEYGIDMLSASGHKFNGPKGIGFLYIRTGLKVRSFMHGGGQERGRRAGTENIPAIVGLAKAAELAHATMEERMAEDKKIRDYIIERIKREIPYCRLNGDAERRLPNNVNMSFEFVEGESLLMLLDMEKICASSGSACTSGSLDPSHVLLAIGLPHEIAHGSVRLTIAKDIGIYEADVVIDVLKKMVERLRNMSPLYDDFLNKDKQ